MYCTWRIKLVDEVVAASARPDDAFRWITSVNERATDADLQDVRFPWMQPLEFETLDAKLAAALTKIISGDFARKVQVLKMNALEKGQRVSGRQLLAAIDKHFKMTEADGAVFGVEHLLSVVMKNDNLERFLDEWDTVIAGMKHVPDKMVLETLLMRQLKLCSQMKDDVNIFERLSMDDEKRSYEELLRAARRQVERKRLQLHRDTMSRFISGGNALSAGKDQGRGRSKGKGKGKTLRGRSTSKGRSTSRGPQENKPAEDSQEICRFHLKGKCRAGNSCSMKHNPPCRYVNTKQGCFNGDKCPFPHVKPTTPAAPATENAKSRVPSTGGTARNRSTSRRRSLSKPRGKVTGPAPTAVAQIPPQDKGHAVTALKWVLDSGSAFDIINRAALSRSAVKRIVPATHPPQLVTANGVIEADMVLPLELKGAGIATNALVLEDSPSVLSLGKKVCGGRILI